MTEREFCYWLQGFFELHNTEVDHLNKEQVQTIKEHLQLVFHKVTNDPFIFQTDIKTIPQGTSTAEIHNPFLTFWNTPSC